MQPITYSRSHMVSFQIYQVKIGGIQLLKSQKLTLYQKYIIYLLNIGVNAKNRTELIEKISRFLNLKQAIVQEFINLLFDLRYILFDGSSEYKLSQRYELILDESNRNMLGHVTKAEKAVDGIYMIDQLYQTFTKTDLNKYGFKQNHIEGENLIEINKTIKHNFSKYFVRDSIEKFIVEESGHLYKLAENFKCEFEEVIALYKVDVNCKRVYEYKDGVSKVVDVVFDGEMIPELVQLQKREDVYDTELPLFIQDAYERIRKLAANQNSIDNKKIEQEDLLLEIVQLENQVDNDKRELKNIENHHVDSQVATRKKLVATEIEAKQELNNSINKKNKKINEKTTELNISEKKSRKLEEEIKEMVIEMNTILPEIAKVYDKYLESKIGCKILSNKIREICVLTCDMIEQSNLESYDEFENTMQKSKDLFKQTLKVIFSVALSKSLKNLVDVYDESNIVTYESKLKNKNVRSGVLRNLKTFHRLSNSYGHINDDGITKTSNKEIIESFKQDEVNRRRIVLSAPIQFLLQLELSSKELKNIEIKFNDN